MKIYFYNNSTNYDINSQYHMRENYEKTI